MNAEQLPIINEDEGSLTNMDNMNNSMPNAIMIGNTGSASPGTRSPGILSRQHSSSDISQISQISQSSHTNSKQLGSLGSVQTNQTTKKKKLNPREQDQADKAKAKITFT